MNHRVVILSLAFAGCAFEPTGAGPAGDPDAPAIDVDGPASDGPAIDGSAIDAPMIDGPVITVDAAIDAPSVEAGVVRVAAASAQGAVDGMDGEYASATVYAMDLGGAGHRDFLTGYVPSMRAELRAAQDAAYLYLLVEVVESGMHYGDSAETWQNDAVTFYFDTNNDRSGAYGNDDHEIIVDFFPRYAIYPTDNGVANPTIEAVRLDTAEGFTVEARILKSTLGLPSARKGFGWGLYDDDGGGNADAYGLWYERPAQRCATCCTGEDHAEAWCDTTLLGEIQFN